MDTQSSLPSLAVRGIDNGLLFRFRDGTPLTRQVFVGKVKAALMQAGVWHAVSNKNQFKLVSFNPGFYHTIRVPILQSRFLSYNPGSYLSIRVPIIQFRFLSFNPGFYHTIRVPIFQSRFLSHNPGSYPSIRVSIIQSGFLSFNPGSYHTIPVSIFKSRIAYFNYQTRVEASHLILVSIPFQCGCGA